MLIAGNWKMNTDVGTAAALAEDVSRALSDGAGDVTVAVCPPFVSLDAVSVSLRGTPVRVGAQNMHDELEGAFTGEISAPMLKSVGCDYVILGHSERRQYFGETDEKVNRKVHVARDHGLIPIVCVGETLDERKERREKEVVRRQLEDALRNVELADDRSLVIAYEPVWAIGTGETATPDQAQEMHAFIRGLLRDQFGTAASDIEILYGGSMKPSNSDELLAQRDVDGGLIGGASLRAADFAAIVHAARNIIV